MGCASSKNDAVVAEDAPSAEKTAEVKQDAGDAKEETAPESVPAAGEGEVKVEVDDGKPKPQLFAIMRNGHEVIRGAQKDLEAFLEAGELEPAKELWVKLHKWSDLHMKMEEGTHSDKSPVGMFKLLDKNFDNIAKEKGLYKDHKDLHKKEKALDAAFETGDAAKVKEAFDAFGCANLVHLKKEESIMMPKIEAFKEGGHPMKKYMQQDILAAVKSADMEHFIKFSNEMLEKHANGEPRVRVFDHALNAAATPEQWTQWDQWIKEAVSETTYEEIQQAINA